MSGRLFKSDIWEQLAEETDPQAPTMTSVQHLAPVENRWCASCATAWRFCVPNCKLRQRELQSFEQRAPVTNPHWTIPIFKTIVLTRKD
jgi:hypothetical protein